MDVDVTEGHRKDRDDTWRAASFGMAVRPTTIRWAHWHVLCVLLWPLVTAAAIEAPSELQAEATTPAEAATGLVLVRPEDANQADDLTPAPHTTVQRVWRSRIAVPERAEDLQAKTELDRLIRQIRSLKFQMKEQPPAALPPAGPQAGNESQDAAPTQLDAGQPARTSAPRTALQPSTPWPPETMRALQSIVQDPNHVTEPLEMAELLFLSGRPAEAAVLYRRALDLVSSQDIARNEDRAWILFQLGNCLREEDTSVARNMYATLIAEYPNSPWTELAKATSELLTWQERVRPHDMIVSLPSQP